MYEHISVHSSLASHMSLFSASFSVVKTQCYPPHDLVRRLYSRQEELIVFHWDQLFDCAGRYVFPERVPVHDICEPVISLEFTVETDQFVHTTFALPPMRSRPRRDNQLSFLSMVSRSNGGKQLGEIEREL